VVAAIARGTTGCSYRVKKTAAPCGQTQPALLPALARDRFPRGLGRCLRANRAGGDWSAGSSPAARAGQRGENRHPAGPRPIPPWISRWGHGRGTHRDPPAAACFHAHPGPPPASRAACRQALRKQHGSDRPARLLRPRYRHPANFTEVSNRWAAGQTPGAIAAACNRVPGRPVNRQATDPGRRPLRAQRPPARRCSTSAGIPRRRRNMAVLPGTMARRGLGACYTPAPGRRNPQRTRPRSNCPSSRADKPGRHRSRRTA